MVSKFRRAVVTGGAGFLGSRACRRLVGQGTAVVCLDNFLTGGRAAIQAPPGGPRFESRFCDVSETDITLARTALGFEPLIGWHQGLAETIAWAAR